jgi:hypothetical protein
MAHLAALHKGHKAAVSDLYEWLGVATEPRFKSIVARVKDLVASSYSAGAAKQVQDIVAHLGTRLGSSRDVPELTSLTSNRWLPARGRGDRWYGASELYATYQAYLFESQALFLDVPANIQNASRPVLEFLGIHLTPPADLVVKHLLHCAAEQIPVNAEVYRFLNDNVKDAAIGQLKGKKCLWLGDAYHASSRVFWGEHPFGRYRRRLGEGIRNYSELLTELRVRETPTWEDALSVLREIATDFGSQNRPLDDEAHAVLMACWRIIGQALDKGTVPALAISELSSVKCVPNPSRVLNPPEWMFFENRAGLAAKFGPFLVNNVIPRPMGTGDAMAVAGVRPLGTAVRVELLECVDPIDDPRLGERLRARRNEIGRVLEAHSVGHDTATVLQTLAAIQCQSTSSIEIRYQLHVFNRDLESDKEQVPSLFLAEQETLLYTPRNSEVPWAAISRELATALFPEEDPGRYAAGLKEALAAESVEEAGATLDELGFARLDTSIAEPIAPGGPIEALGTQSPVEGGIPPVAESENEGEEVQELTPEEAIKRLLGGDAPPPSPAIFQPETEPSGTSGGPSGSKPSRTSPKKILPVLRSYLPAPGAGDAELTGDLHPDGQGRPPVDEAGVRHVMEHEFKAGRKPKEMPHKNPGYDIESRDADGNVLRYIEVKSFSGRWNSTYAVLSRPQFNKAHELGDLFWLYVVERAESEDFQIHRIQNPPSNANHFMFDSGWRTLAEPVPPSPEGK